MTHGIIVLILLARLCAVTPGLRINGDDIGEYVEVPEPWEAPIRSNTPMYGFVKKAARPHDFASAIPANTGLCFWVSKKYKFIGIKVKKTGGSTFLKKMKEVFCGITFPGPYNVNAKCPSKYVFDHGQSDDHDCQWNSLPPASEWDDYFVFTVVRNPWARRASMLQYCKMHDIAGVKSCAVSPYKNCGSCSLAHCKPYGQGLMSPSGDSFVDYIGHTESLDADMETIIGEIARRYAANNAGRSIDWLNTTAHMKAVNQGRPSSYAAKYAQEPSCVGSVQNLYPVDASPAFGYMPPPSGGLAYLFSNAMKAFETSHSSPL